MSGLGIDFGKPTAEQQPRRQQQRPHTGYGTPDSYTQLPPNSRLNISRRPTTADDRMALRRVRIASGEPGVMGHGVGHLEEDYIMSPDNQSDMGMSSVSGSSTRSISQDHRKRLSDAVAAMSDSPYDDTSPYSGTSSLYEDSPGTETSATSFTSSNRSGSSGSRRLKKQTSQPVLSRTATRRGGNASMSGPPRASAAAMNRSQSSMSLSSSYKSSESGSTLGRSAEIPRNAGRNGSTNSRGSARGRGRGGGGGRGPHIRMQTSDGSRMLPDGFGGVVPSNWLPPDARRAASDRSTPASTISPTSSTASGRHREGLPCFDGPSLMDRMGDIQDNASEAGSTRSSVRSSGAQQRVQSPEDHPQQPARPVKFRVGSFYGPNGQVVCQSERAQPDQTSASESTNAPNSAPTAHDEERGRSDQRSASSAPASQRQRSQSGPRARLMDSPTTSRQNDPQDGETKTTAEMQRSLSSSMVSMRSVAGWRGLDGAEKGEAMSMLDSTQPSPATHSARMSRSMSIAGTELAPMDSVSNVGPTQSNGSAQTEGRPAHSRSLSAAAVPSASAYTKTKATALDRQPTLLSATANPLRRSRELNRLLGTSGRKLHSSAASSVDSVISPQDAPAGGKSTGLSRSNATAGSSVPPAVLEQAKAGKARVEVDLVLESDLVVEGGMLRGRLQVKVRKDSDKDGAIMLAQPKVRVVGFEELLNDDTRHIFYHHATVIDGDRSAGAPSEAYVLHGSPNLSSPDYQGRPLLPCFASTPDQEGFCRGKEGVHSIPFAVEIPIGKGAKGSYRGKHAVVRYIVIGSVKLKSSMDTNRSIAHFYRHVELYPYLNPAVVLSSAARPLQATASKGLFLGGSGKVRLTASLHRSTWVAGQRVYVNVAVHNETSKKVKSLTLSLIRTVTLFRPRLDLIAGERVNPIDPHETCVDPDACSTSTSRKKISEETLEMGQKGSKGFVTARGWWTGVEPGGSVDFSHYMSLPVDALSVTRGRHVEVQYSIKVAVGSSLSSDVYVELPLRVINFVSLDPPPIKSASSSFTLATAMGRAWSSTAGSETASTSTNREAPMIARVRSLDALRVPPRADQVPVNPRPFPLSANLSGAQGPAPAADDDATRSRRLQHQKSLDFINHAIKSATARRGAAMQQKPNEPSPMGLGIEVPENAEEMSPYYEEGEATPTGSYTASSVGSITSAGPVNPSCMPYEHPYPPTQQVTFPLHQINSVSLDEIGDDFDETDGDKTLGLNEDSVDEVDLVIGSSQFDLDGSPNFQSLPEQSVDGDMSASFEVDSHGIREESESEEEDAEGHNYSEYDQHDQRPQSKEPSRGAQGTTPTLPTQRIAVEQRDSPGVQSEKIMHSNNPSPTAQSEAAPNPSPTAQSEAAPSPLPKSPVKTSSAAKSPRKTLDASPATSPRKNTPTLHRTTSNFELRTPNPRPSSRTSSPTKATGSRPSSPTKPSGSPLKPSLKSKSSFSFATSSAPLKVKVGEQSPSKEAPRAKVLPSLIANPSSQAARPLPTVPASNHGSSPASQVGGSPNKLHHSPKKSVSRHDGQISPADSQEEYGSEEGTPVDSRSSGSSPATSASALTPKSEDTPLPGDDVVRIVDTYSTFPSTPARARSGSMHAVVFDREKKSDSSQPNSVTSTPNSGGGTLRHSVSTATLTGERLQRSHSTHTLRGSAVVLPSVRSKIAMLEGRTQALKDFTGTGSEAGSVASTPTAGRTPTQTPTKAAAVVDSLSRIPGSGSRMGGTPASASAGSPRKSRLAGDQAQAPDGGSPSAAKLSRKTSVLSAASEDSDPPEYLRRAPSVMSFKAPVLRNVTSKGVEPLMRCDAMPCAEIGRGRDRS